MYDFIQTALTATTEAIALIAIVGLPAHYIVMSHVREVQSWGTPHTTPAKEVKPEVKPEVKAVAIEQPEAEAVTEVVHVGESRRELARKRSPIPVWTKAVSFQWSAIELLLP
jgi:hypothetical protein